MLAAVVVGIALADYPALEYSKWVGKSVLLVSAHPDDIEAGAGALVSFLRAQGTTVSFFILTNGDKGCGWSVCANWTNQQIAVARQQEAIAGAAVMGVPASAVLFGGYEDYMLRSAPDADVRRDVIAAARSVRADIVFSWLPTPTLAMPPSEGWQDLGYHPDHMAAGSAALSSAFGAGLSRLFPAAGAAYGGGELYFFTFALPSLAGVRCVDIGEAGLATKIAAFKEHRTQYGDDFRPAAASFRALALQVGRMCGKNFTLAEAFTPFV